MNWYKKSQKLPTMEDITWAIDKLIAENYDFSVEELMQASQTPEEQYALPKAAQTATKRKPRKGVSPKLNNISRSQSAKIFELFEQGRSTIYISQKLDIPSPQIAKVIKTKYPNKEEREGYLRRTHEKNILDTTEKLHTNMKKDFNIMNIGPQDIASVLNIDEGFVSRTLKNNGINDLSIFSKERKRIIAKNISDIVEELPFNFKQKDIIAEFEKRYNYTVSLNAVDRAIAIDNLGQKKQDNPESIFKGFTKWIDSIITNGGKVLLEKEEKQPGTVASYIDRFFTEKGDRYGFVSPYTKENLKNMFLTKDQMSKNVLNKERYKYTPVDYTDQNPATFIQDRGEQSELV